MVIQYILDQCYKKIKRNPDNSLGKCLQVKVSSLAFMMDTTLVYSDGKLNRWSEVSKTAFVQTVILSVLEF